MSHTRRDVGIYFGVYLILLVLLALTVEAVRHDLGHWNVVVTLSIAAAKAILIVLFFMHVRHGKPLVKLVIAAGLLWLAIMFSLSLSDYRTREWDFIIGGTNDALRSSTVE